MALGNECCEATVQVLVAQGLGLGRGAGGRMCGCCQSRSGLLVVGGGAGGGLVCLVECAARSDLLHGQQSKQKL